jgi:hypothetical protein
LRPSQMPAKKMQNVAASQKICFNRRMAEI